MSKGGGEFTGKRFNQNVDSSVDDYREMVSKVIGWLTEDGPPPGFIAKDPYARLERLRGLKAAQSVEFWGDPRAQRELANLEMRFA